jgi:hypothetical protein
MTYSLSVAAIFRNEARYLKEWIDFHRLVGCEHFYLFDNLSTDAFREVLSPYVRQGIVELFSWPIEHDQVADWSVSQCLAYERALYLARGKTKWLAILDTDEFLFPSKGGNLLDCLMPYEGYGGVGVNWQVFGTSRISLRPDQLLTESLHLKLPEKAPQNTKIKSIVRPERVLGCSSSHFVDYLPPFTQVKSDHVPFQGRDSPYIQIDTLRINHYQTRDLSYLRNQKIPRCIKWWNAQPKEVWESYFETFNVEQYEAIFRFLPALKRLLAQ